MRPLFKIDVSFDADGTLQLLPTTKEFTAAMDRIILDAVMNGQGVGLVRKSLAQEMVNEGKIVRVLDYEMPSPYSYYLVAPEHNFQKPKVQIFQDWLRKELESSFLPEHFAYYGS